MHNQTGRGCCRLILMLCVLLITGLSSAWADQGEAQLASFFDDMQTLDADFVQDVTDVDGASIQYAEGHMWLQRPGLFRWDYQSPYHQLIVGDGNQVWVYDEDLEQVTVRSFDSALGQTPALLLSGETPLLESFSVTSLGDQHGMSWYLLLPNGRDAVFDELRLGIAKGVLQIMELRDGLGHKTKLRFSVVKKNRSIDSQRFIFIAPEGVDVIRDSVPAQ